MIIVLKQPDEDYEIQSRMVDSLIKKRLISQRDVINITESTIEINADEGIANKASVALTLGGFNRYMDMKQCEFSDGGISGGVSDSVTSGTGNLSTSDQNGEGVNSGIVVGVGEGMGNANLKGTTFITGNKGRSKIDVNEILYCKDNYTKNSCPQITYNGSVESTVFIPATQETYSVGVLSSSNVNYLNEQFLAQQKIFSDYASEEPENKGNIAPMLTTGDILPDHNMDVPKADPAMVVEDDQLRKLSEDRSKDARDPLNVPANVLTRRQLSDVIAHGTSSKSELPTLNPRAELIQRMLAFAAHYDLDQCLYSVTSFVAKQGTKMAVKGAVKSTINGVAQRQVAPYAGEDAANKVGSAANKMTAGVRNNVANQAGNIAAKMFK